MSPQSCGVAGVGDEGVDGSYEWPEEEEKAGACWVWWPGITGTVRCKVKEGAHWRFIPWPSHVTSEGMEGCSFLY